MDKPLGGQLPLDEGLWAELSSLSNLNLANTGISGFLPPQMGALKAAQFITLGGNDLEGGWSGGMIPSGRCHWESSGRPQAGSPHPHHAPLDLQACCPTRGPT